MPSINDFYGALNKAKGPAKTTNYLVHITSLKIGTRLNETCMMCDQVELPGKTFNTTEYKTYGPSRKMPYVVQYQDLNMSFICTNQMNEKRYFDFWQTLISDPEYHGIGYYDEYVAEVYIFLLNPEHKPSYGVKLEEAYPLNIQAIPLSYADTNTYARLNVQMAYKKWSHLPVTVEDYLPTIDLGSFANDLINNLVRF